MLGSQWKSNIPVFMYLKNVSTFVSESWYRNVRRLFDSCRKLQHFCNSLQYLRYYLLFYTSILLLVEIHTCFEIWISYHIITYTIGNFQCYSILKPNFLSCDDAALSMWSDFLRLAKKPMKVWQDDAVVLYRVFRRDIGLYLEFNSN
jgi:hypothetical protein